MVAVEKLELVNSNGDGGKECNFLLQVAIMILDVKGLIN